MITHFPTPHPDELLYSLCARYGDRTRYSAKGAISAELFGLKGLTATIDLPSRLGYLVGNLPEGHTLLLNRLIDEHTLLPFYSPFLEKERVGRLRCEMEGTGGGIVHKIAAITPSTVRPPNYLRFCPLCVEYDKREFKECYWHRLHQLPGILVCPKHKAFLENSTVQARNRVYSCAYISAEQAELHINAKLLDMTDNSHLSLMFISQCAEWLLNQRGLVPGYDVIHAHYIEGFTAKGLAYPGRFIRTSKLPEAMRYTFPQTMLATIQCDFDDSKEYCWPSILVKELRSRKANHPLRHLLFIGLLGQTPKSFFRISTTNQDEDDFLPLKQISTYKYLSNSKATILQGNAPAIMPDISYPPGVVSQKNVPFGLGPWPCLNIACNFYQKPVITSCHVQKHWEVKTIIVGFFKCKCGFIYRRNGPDKSLADQLKFDSIKTYGGVWIGRLRQLWNDLTISIHKMVPLLGITHNSIDSHAKLLGLQYPRHGPGNKITYGVKRKHRNRRNRNQIKTSLPSKASLHKRFRRELLKIIEDHPTSTRTALSTHLASQAYRWLMKNDREWLEIHSPPPIKRIGSNRKVDWVTRDAQLAKAVSLAAQRLSSTEGRPVRMTVKLIGHYLDKSALLNSKKFSAKIPLTTQVLSEIVETHLTFVTRCVRWAASCYRREGIIPSISAFARRAGMTMSTTYRPEIRSIINEELDSLRNIKVPPEHKAA
jgi:hypothetical protein